MKKSAHQIWHESKEKNLTKEEFKEELKSEGVIIKKMTPKEKARDILEKVNNGKISKALWDNCSDYAKTDLKRKAMIIVAEIISALKELGEELYDKQGTDSYNARCLNHDKKQYWKCVKIEIDCFYPLT